MGNEDIETARKLELYKIHSASFELSEGDTLIIIDYPTSPRRPSGRQADCNGKVYNSQQFRVHSEKLRSTGSAKFMDMLGPSYQFRVQRRRGLVNKLPEGVKYVLDMTPAFEGDDLVFQMTELSLTPGIIKWWTSTIPYDVDEWLVAGHDDICACLPELFKDQEEPKPGAPNPNFGKNRVYNRKYPNFHYTPNKFAEMRRNNENNLYDIPAYRIIPDYCPIRHRNSIIRLFMLIEGKDVTLDSANRLWTLVKLCNIWDCPDVIRDQATQWLLHGTNSRFIEVLPEEALQIGFALQLPGITQCAFRILVNELALQEAADPSAQKGLDRVTVFGRRRGDLPDELSNLVQHAARAFVERASALAEKLEDPTKLEFKSNGEWARLFEIQRLLEMHDSNVSLIAASSDMKRLVDTLVGDFKEEVEKASMVSQSPPSYFYTMDLDRVTFTEPKDFVTTDDIVRDMNLIQRLLCPFIYNNFGTSLDDGLYYSETQGWNTKSHVSFPRMVGYVATDLRQAIVNDPATMKSLEWAPIYAPHVDLTSEDKVRAVGPMDLKWPFFDMKALEKELKEIFRPITTSWIRHDIEPQLNITRHMLLTLTNDEFKYLPLWAGGCNDGTGGVFESYLPPADMGPNGPGPSYHTGLTVPSNPSSISSSMLDDMRTLRVMGSTTAGSIDVHDSISTVYRPDRVIADDVSIASESFTIGGSEYQAAQFEVPAEHQPMGQAVPMLVDTTDTESQATAVDEDFVYDGDSGDDMEFWEDDSDTAEEDNVSDL